MFFKIDHRQIAEEMDIFVLNENAHKMRPFVKLIVGKKEISSGEYRLQMRSADLILQRHELISHIAELVKAPE